MAELLIAKIVSTSIPLLAKYIQNKVKRNKRTKVEKEVAEKVAIINLSGHPLTNNAKKEIDSWAIPYHIVSKSVPSIDLTDKELYMENIVNFVTETIKELIKKDGLLYHLLEGRFVLIPSGMSSLCSTEIVMLHGISGHFPKCAYTYKANFGFSLTPYFDFQVLRTEMRDLR